jgi:hypothetical protein
MLFSRNKKPKEEPKQEVVGGFPFFLSLAALLPTGILFFVLALLQIRHADPLLAVSFLAACLAGCLVAQIAIRGHISVLLHEFKHALISNLVGNKNKRMKIEQNSGHLEYAYTKKTAHYNAFIALAPYIVPVCTFVMILISAAVAWGNPLVAAVLVGFGYGADLLLNARDISPVQTDISLISGGYGVGLAYITAWNLLTTALILAWAFQGIQGIAALFVTVSKALFTVYFWGSGTTPEIS